MLLFFQYYPYTLHRKSLLFQNTDTLWILRDFFKLHINQPFWSHHKQKPLGQINVSMVLARY